MTEQLCKNCAFYSQHYALNGQQIFRVYCGHCRYGKVKNRLPDSKACEHFAPGEPDTAAFVTKKYLSKELLRYWMSLELLPEITDDDASRR